MDAEVLKYKEQSSPITYTIFCLQPKTCIYCYKQQSVNPELDKGTYSKGSELWQTQA